MRNEDPWQYVHTTQPMRASPSKKKKETPTGGKGELPLFIPNLKEQLRTHTRELNP